MIFEKNDTMSPSVFPTFIHTNDGFEDSYNKNMIWNIVQIIFLFILVFASMMIISHTLHLTLIREMVQLVESRTPNDSTPRD